MKLDKILEECFPSEMFLIVKRKEKIGTEYYEVQDKIGNTVRALFFRYEDNPTDKKVHYEINGVMNTCGINDLKTQLVSSISVAMNIKTRVDEIS